MHGRVEGQYGHNGSNGGVEVGPVSQECDGAVVEDVKERYLPTAVAYYHEDSVQKLVQLGHPVYHHAVTNHGVACFHGKHTAYLTTTSQQMNNHMLKINNFFLLVIH